MPPRRFRHRPAGAVIRAGLRPGPDVVRLQIDEMRCQGCANAASEALSRMDGVVEPEVSFDDGLATVTCEPGRVDSQTLVDTLQPVEMGGVNMPFEVSLGP